MIIVNSISKKYIKEKKETVVLKNISFDIEKGSVVAVLGHNGSGKSTLLKCIVGVLKPSTGKISLFGKDSFKYRAKNTYDMGVLFNQKPSFIIDLSINENLRLFKSMYGLSESNFEEMKTLFLSFVPSLEKLLEKQYRKLSFGERVLCEIFSLILHNPKVLVLDEPTIGLDYNVKKQVYAFINHLNKTYKTTILITTHEVDYICEFSTHTIILENGELIYYGDSDLFNSIDTGEYDIEVEYMEIFDLVRFNKIINTNPSISAKKDLVAIKSKTPYVDGELIGELGKVMNITSIKSKTLDFKEVYKNVLSKVEKFND